MNRPFPSEDTPNVVAGTLGGEATGTMSDAVLHVHRLEPSAEADDPHWDIAPGHGVVMVRAASPADARIVAAEAEIDFLDIEAKPGDGTTTFASAFRNEKMYHVSDEPNGRYSSAGERCVIARFAALFETSPGAA